MSSSSSSSSLAKKKPSLYARKLLDKLRTLHFNASLESRQTLANWMVFNRKKAEGMAEGIVLAIIAATNVMEGGGGGTLQEKEEEDTSLPRLMLLLRVIHQVFMEGKDDSDQFEKSAQLRTILADVALIPLFQALANNTATTSETEQQQQRETYHSEVKEMIDSWKEFSVFDGPTVWEGYKKAWGRAVVDAAANAATTKSGGDESTTNDSIVDASPPDGESRSSTNDAPMDVAMGGQSSTLEEGTQPSASLSLTKDDSSETNQGEDDAIKKKEATATIALSSTPTESPSIEDTNNNKMEVTNTNQDDEKPSLSNKRDSMTSVTSIDIDFDAEGVEEADVEPATFLEASKVIASLQIARDLGSDAAMNLSSALGSVPAEVEQACSTIHAQQQEGGDEGTISIEELLSTEQLSNLPDEILDIDLDYARKSLQTYREAILQQRKARLQCLQLLLQSRCSFGSLDAARAFGCDGGSDKGMNIILEQLKKVKDKLIDAMALEGLDVEEDDTMKEEEEQLKPLSWFPGQTKESEEEPAQKKQKVA
ncbi:hypothetical protein ACHAWT_007421 [Skeletonema menzelii]